MIIDAGGPVAPLLEYAAALGAAADPCTAHPPPLTTTCASSTKLRERWPELAVLIHPLERELWPESTGHAGAGAAVDFGALRSSRCTPPATPPACCRCCVDGTDVFTGDTLFKGSVGGVRAPGHTTYADLKNSIMDTLMKLPPQTRDPSGPHRPDDRRPRVEHNPFVRVWRGLDPEGSEPCTALGEPATLILLGRRLRRRPQGVGALARRLGRHRAGIPGASRRAAGKRVAELARQPGAPAERLRSAMASRESKDKIPTSRVRRTATVGSWRPGEAVKQFGTRAANVTRGEQASEAALARRQLETAEQIVAALGTMKGAAMKLGQVMSFLDVGLVREEYREEFQHELAKLRDAAPTVSFKQMRKVIEDDLDERRSRRCSTTSTRSRSRRPRSGRSTARAARRPRGRRQGPVPRGRRGGPRRHAEPGHDHAAAQADDARARRRRRRQEIRARIGEELDYELEAQNQRSLARIFRGHPFIAIPDVVTGLSRERVSPDHARRGRGLRGAQAPPAARARSRSARSSSASSSAASTATASSPATPTPAIHAARRRAGGVPDFGLFKRMPPAPVELELASPARGHRGRRASVTRLWPQSGSCPSPSESTPSELLAHFARRRSGGTRADAVFALTPGHRHRR